jgi:hypothetical protein
MKTPFLYNTTPRTKSNKNPRDRFGRGISHAKTRSRAQKHATPQKSAQFARFPRCGHLSTHAQGGGFLYFLPYLPNLPNKVTTYIVKGFLYKNIIPPYFEGESGKFFASGGFFRRFPT